MTLNDQQLALQTSMRHRFGSRQTVSRTKRQLHQGMLYLEPRRFLTGLSYSTHDVAADRPDSLQLADLDGDHHLDLIVMNTVGGVSWQHNEGEGKFGAPQTIAEDGKWSGRGLLVEDWNNDGDLDVVVANSRGVRAYENLDGHGQFRARDAVMTDWDYLTYFLDLADMDGDGDQDLLWAAFNDPRVLWLENIDGAGDFLIAHAIDTDARFETVSIQGGDFDADGDIDVAIGSTDFGSFAWFQQADGEWQRSSAPPDFLSVAYASRLITADIDSDSDDDLVACSPAPFASCFWYENIRSDNALPIHAILPRRLDWYNNTMVDWDIDGDPDILYCTDNQIGWLENTQTDFRFVDQQLVKHDTFRLEIRSIVSGDVNDDGRPDLFVVAANSSSIVWYRSELPGDSNHDRHFDSTDLLSVFQIGKYATDVTASFAEGDWNNDGVFDSSDFVFVFQFGNFESKA